MGEKVLLAAARSTFRGGVKSYWEAPRKLQAGCMGEKVLLAAARNTFRRGVKSYKEAPGRLQGGSEDAPRRLQGSNCTNPGPA